MSLTLNTSSSSPDGVGVDAVSLLDDVDDATASVVANYDLDYLDAEEAAFVSAHRHERIVIDPTLRLIILNYLSPGPDAALVKELVPPGVDIFHMMNLEVPRNVSRLEGWAIMIYPNSTQYTTLQATFGNIREMLYHLTIPEVTYNVLLFVYLPILFLGAVLNAVNLFVILTSAKLRRDPRNSFIVALAFSDLFLCIFTSPLTLWYTLEGHWPLGGNTELLCKFVKAAQEFPIFMSSFCIGAIACDRFRFIVHSHRKQMTAPLAVIISVILVLVSSAFVSPFFATAKLSQYGYLGRRYFCDLDLSAFGTSLAGYTQVTNLFHFLITLIIVSGLYAAIYMRLRLRPPSQHAAVNRRRRRTNIFLALITAVFFLGWAPMVVYSVLFDYFPQLLPQRQSMIFVGYAVTLAVGMLTAIANPILYTSLNEGFREAAPAICKSVCWLCCWKEDSEPARSRLGSHAMLRSESEMRRRPTVSLERNNCTEIEVECHSRNGLTKAAVNGEGDRGTAEEEEEDSEGRRMLNGEGEEGGDRESDSGGGGGVRDRENEVAEEGEEEEAKILQTDL